MERQSTFFLPFPNVTMTLVVVSERKMICRFQYEVARINEEFFLSNFMNELP